MFKEIDYNKHFVIGTPLVGWKADMGEEMSWLENSKQIIEKFPNAKFFTALELDSRGLQPFERVLNTLKEINGDFWTYSINDFEENVTFRNRWIRIETGRNLVREYAQRKRILHGHHWGEDCTEENIGVVNYDAILYVDSDIILTAELIEKLFEVDHPIVSADVPAYGLRGKAVSDNPRIEEHWNTAGMLLVNSPAFYDLPWYHNDYLNLSDDPTFQSMAERLKVRVGLENLDHTYGMTWVRKDIKAEHKGQLLPVENRKIPPREI